jgi:hypothetical protein
VSDAYGRQDAIALYQFLLGRGYLLPDPAADSALPVLPCPLPALKRGATPLTGVDMIKVIGLRPFLPKYKTSQRVIRSSMIALLLHEPLHSFVCSSMFNPGVLDLCRLLWPE